MVPDLQVGSLVLQKAGIDNELDHPNENDQTKVCQKFNEFRFQNDPILDVLQHHQINKG